MDAVINVGTIKANLIKRRAGERSAYGAMGVPAQAFVV